MYGSGIRALDNLAGELDENSQSTFGNLNTQVQMHTSSLEDVSVKMSPAHTHHASNIYLNITL